MSGYSTSAYSPGGWDEQGNIDPGQVVSAASKEPIAHLTVPTSPTPVNPARLNLLAGCVQDGIGMFVTLTERYRVAALVLQRLDEAGLDLVERGQGGA